MPATGTVHFSMIRQRDNILPDPSLSFVPGEIAGSSSLTAKLRLNHVVCSKQAPAICAHDSMS